MTIYVLILMLLVLIPTTIAIAWYAKGESKRRRQVRGPEEPKKIEPVTLDRNPDMPHRPGATS